MELEEKYEDKLRKSLTYLGDKFEWPLVYDQLARVISIYNETKVSEEALTPIMNKWIDRKKEMALLCYYVIIASHDQIEKTFDIVYDLIDFNNKRIHLQRMIDGYLDDYKSQKFELFPHALDKDDTLKGKDACKKFLGKRHLSVSLSLKLVASHGI